MAEETVFDVSLQNGKYRAVCVQDTSTAHQETKVLRHGEPWPAYPTQTLNNFEFALCQELQATRERLASAEQVLRDARTLIADYTSQIGKVVLQDYSLANSVPLAIDRLLPKTELELLREKFSAVGAIVNPLDDGVLLVQVPGGPSYDLHKDGSWFARSPFGKGALGRDVDGLIHRIKTR